MYAIVDVNAINLLGEPALQRPQSHALKPFVPAHVDTNQRSRGADQQRLRAASEALSHRIENLIARLHANHFDLQNIQCLISGKASNPPQITAIKVPVVLPQRSAELTYCSI
jgi:hypothetical protein